MSVKLGINPIGWTNDCMGWLGDLILPDTCLAEARAAGFSGVELGRKLPRDSKRLSPMLKPHKLRLVSGWYSAMLASRYELAEIAAMAPHLNLLKALGSPIMVFAETTGEIVNNVALPLSARPRLRRGQEWRTLGRRFSEVARPSGGARRRGPLGRPEGADRRRSLQGFARTRPG